MYCTYFSFSALLYLLSFSFVDSNTTMVLSGSYFIFQLMRDVLPDVLFLSHGPFWLFRDVNISFFLSFFLSLLHTHTHRKELTFS